eukprot:m51a1_g2196 hypothetical protein (211) ;mRNA; f:136992-137686
MPGKPTGSSVSRRAGQYADLYAYCYCEENVHGLAQRLASTGVAPLSALHALFVSNDHRTVPVFSSSGLAHVWDYHVVLVQRWPEGSEAVVWDFDADAQVPFPCPLGRFAAVCLAHGEDLPASYRRRYRAVPAGVYVATLSSDRSHMRAPDGSWLQPPPQRPALRPEGQPPTNLFSFVDMRHSFHGTVLDGEAALLRFFRGPSSGASSPAS